MINHNQKSKCPECGKIAQNAFSHPYDRVECMGKHYSPRTENEYFWKCPHCGQITISPHPPYDT